MIYPIVSRMFPDVWRNKSENDALSLRVGTRQGAMTSRIDELPLIGQCGCCNYLLRLMAENDMTAVTTRRLVTHHPNTHIITN